MKELIPYRGKKSPSEYIDEVFSRNVLGSVAVGSSFMKVVENGIKSHFIGLDPHGGLAASWFATFLISIVAFAYWDDIIDKASEAVEQAAGENSK